MRLKAKNFNIIRKIYPNHEKTGQFFKRLHFSLVTGGFSNLLNNWNDWNEIIDRNKQFECRNLQKHTRKYLIYCIYGLISEKGYSSG